MHYYQRNLIIISVLVGLALSSIIVVDASGALRDSRKSMNVNQVNEYTNYIHFQPEWNSHPRNLIIDTTTSWERHILPGEEKSDISKHGAKHRQNTLQYVNGKPVVIVQFDYMDCQSQWIHYTKSGLDFLVNNLEQHNQNKQISNKAYSDELQQLKLRDGFAQFIPICTSKNSTSYDYRVSINDDTVGFDVYFVSSLVQQWNYFLFPDHFEHYSDEGCFGHNFQKFTGSCSNVTNTGGLLIVIQDELSRPVSKITVNMFEQ